MAAVSLRACSALSYGGRAFALALGLALTLSFTPARAAESYSARLTMVPIDLRTSADVTGSGSASAVLDGTRLSVSGTFTGLKMPATIARLHEGPATGVRGPGVADFTVPQAASGSFSLQLQLTPEQLQSLRQGRLYIQVHSESAPDGNLWGWLLP